MAAAVAATATSTATAQNYPSGSEISKSGLQLHLENYATVPKSAASNTTYVARINFLRSEPAGAPGSATRFFAVDNNANMYVLDKATRSFDSVPGGAVNPYINFPSFFTRFDNNPGFAAGAVTFQFDPEYATPGPNFGKFYTTHTERLDDNPASEYRRAVLTAWQDTNINDNVFTGTNRLLLTADYQNNIHPMGDIAFNPNAGPGHPDYRNMYISSGDGGAGETTAGRTLPQDLNNVVGKVLRIQPDGAGPGQYGIPSDNPFVSTPGARPEVWANGFRNPHRMYWDAPTDKLIVNDIGFHRWEEINIVRRGENYGYSDIEGDMFMSVPTGNVTAIPGGTDTSQYTFPAAAYSHQDGDAITSGFVYRGTKIPELQGKYIFGDITTARIFYCDYAELLAMESDGNRHSQATIREFQIMFNGVARNLADVIRDEFDLRGDGVDDNDGLPAGRADIRLAMGLDGELYILSKSDGMIRAIVPEPGGALALAGLALVALRRRGRARAG